MISDPNLPLGTLDKYQRLQNSRYASRINQKTRSKGKYPNKHSKLKEMTQIKDNQEKNQNTEEMKKIQKISPPNTRDTTPSRPPEHPHPRSEHRKPIFDQPKPHYSSQLPVSHHRHYPSPSPSRKSHSQASTTEAYSPPTEPQPPHSSNRTGRPPNPPFPPSPPRNTETAPPFPPSEPRFAPSCPPLSELLPPERFASASATSSDDPNRSSLRRPTPPPPPPLWTFLTGDRRATAVRSKSSAQIDPIARGNAEIYQAFRIISTFSLFSFFK